MFGQVTTHESLLARLSEGVDSPAWNEFYDRYAELIRNCARRHNVRPPDLDDILQEVLLALTKALPGFQYDPTRGKFRAYLQTVVFHVICRKACQKPIATPPSQFEVLAAGVDPVAEEIWEDEWRQYHMRQAMKTVVMEFNPADRAAFQQYAVEGRPAAEVAAGLSLSLDQVYQAKSRVLRRIGELIRAQIEMEG